MLCSRLVLTIVGPVILMCGVRAVAIQGGDSSALANGARTFESACASCHGNGGAGGDRGPSLVDNRRLRTMSYEVVERIIRGGTPNGMPAFPLPPDTLADLTRYVQSLNTSAFDMPPAGNVEAGERFFFGAGACATCHTVRGRGRSLGPDLSGIGRQLTLSQLTIALTNPEATVAPGYRLVRVRRHDGTVVEGFARNEGNQTLPLQTIDGTLYSLEKGTYSRLPTGRTSLMPALQATADERRDLIAFLSRLDGGTAPAPRGRSTRARRIASCGQGPETGRPITGGWTATATARSIRLTQRTSQICRCSGSTRCAISTTR